jgi:hypothetical protein
MNGLSGVPPIAANHRSAGALELANDCALRLAVASFGQHALLRLWIEATFRAKIDLAIPDGLRESLSM